jgi:hypothetical protein
MRRQQQCETVSFCSWLRIFASRLFTRFFRIRFRVGLSLRKPSGSLSKFLGWPVFDPTGATRRTPVGSDLPTSEILSLQSQVDGVIIWDMVCGTIGRPCPKLHADPSRITVVSHYKHPPPCIYVFPATVPSPRNNPRPVPRIWATSKFSKRSMIASVGDPRRSTTSILKLNIGIKTQLGRPECAGTGSSSKNRRSHQFAGFNHGVTGETPSNHAGGQIPRHKARNDRTTSAPCRRVPIPVTPQIPPWLP